MNSQINLWIIPTRSEGTPDSQQYEVTSFPHPCFQWQHHPDEMPVKACGKMLINEKLESRADATTRHSCCFSFCILHHPPVSSMVPWGVVLEQGATSSASMNDWFLQERMGKQTEEAESNGSRTFWDSSGMHLVSNGLQQPGFLWVPWWEDEKRWG